MNLSNIKLKPKLVTAFLIIGLLPFLIIGIIALTNARSALEQQAFGQLESVRGIKKGQIERFFAERRGDMQVLQETVATLRHEAFSKLNALRQIKAAQIETYFRRVEANLSLVAKAPATATALQSFGQAFVNEGGQASGVAWEIVKNAQGGSFVALQEEQGYYDVFLIRPDGDVVFTAAEEADLGTNLMTGPYRDSGLAEAFRAAQAGEIGFSDYTPYAPSNGEVAAFLAQRVTDETGLPAGVVAIQLPIDRINTTMEERTGLGETGETYLVGPDRLMRSNSYLDPKNRSVQASFANPETGSVETAAVRSALDGQSGADVIIDYNGNPVLSSYGTVEVYGKRWAILAEIDVAEAFVPKDEDGITFYKKYTAAYGYYDLFLINPDGYVFYTVEEEVDYQTNLLTGPYRDSNLGQLVARVIRDKDYGLADFAPYAPSNGAPAAFIAEPVLHHYDGGRVEVEMIVALQLPLAAINTVMQQRDGMGETGETYLIGSDRLMRSDSYLDPDNHSVAASFARPATGSVETQAAKAALAGQTGTEIIIDYNGHPVLSAYAPVELGDVTWALLAEIDETEAFAAVRRIEILLAGVGLVGAGVIALAGYLLARSIAHPIATMTGAMSRLAGGDLSIEVNKEERADEIGAMTHALADLKETSVMALRAQVGLTNVASGVLMADTKGTITFANRAIITIMKRHLDQFRKHWRDFNPEALTGVSLDTFHQHPAHVHGIIDSLTETYRSQIRIGEATFNVILNPVINARGDRLGTVIEWSDITQELAIEKEVSEIVQGAVGGDFSRRIEIKGKIGFMQQLSEGINTILATTAEAVNDLGLMLSALSEGRLTQRITKDYKGVFGTLKTDSNGMAERLTEIVRDIMMTAEQVASASREIASGADDLSERTENQAASLEETAAALEELTSTVRQNTDTVQEANRLSSQAQTVAKRGDGVVQEVVTAMRSIETSSSKIAEIIGVMDEIAFQTNLLALNAAVEAARAGEAGKGFAVVANEVRTLAQRSAEAAKEVRTLIDASGRQVEDGVTLVGKAGSTFQDILAAIDKVATLMGEITSATSEQSEGLEQVNTAVTQMDQMTQENAALVEESAASARTLDEQSNSLQERIGFFKT